MQVQHLHPMQPITVVHAHEIDGSPFDIEVYPDGDLLLTQGDLFTQITAPVLSRVMHIMRENGIKPKTKPAARRSSSLSAKSIPLQVGAAVMAAPVADDEERMDSTPRVRTRPSQNRARPRSLPTQADLAGVVMDRRSQLLQALALGNQRVKQGLVASIGRDAKGQWWGNVYGLDGVARKKKAVSREAARQAYRESIQRLEKKTEI